MVHGAALTPRLKRNTSTNVMIVTNPTNIAAFIRDPKVFCAVESPSCAAAQRLIQRLFHQPGKSFSIWMHRFNTVSKSNLDSCAELSAHLHSCQQQQHQPR